jgi:hypothetical protein
MPRRAQRSLPGRKLSAVTSPRVTIRFDGNKLKASGDVQLR